ncbi:ATP-binding protein [Streptomyces sp. NPDC048330]|uniref:ATP-binding protein n=1 Tax=Streptomyces sp. NPDC048330 TaxID=3365533 RepID=UPI0037168D2B
MSRQDARWAERLRRALRASLKHWNRPDLVADAELLLSELVTNAFLHARGPTVEVRVYRQGSLLMIEVADGSPGSPLPRSPGTDEEHGRGLLIVDAMAHSWGISQDRTTTWCALLLADGGQKAKPTSVGGAPVGHDTARRRPCNAGALAMPGINARMELTVPHWPGNHHAAVNVLHALEHGVSVGERRPLTVRLRGADASGLLNDVMDHLPEFPGFDRAAAGEPECGLRGVRNPGVVLTLPSLACEGTAGCGKTVPSIMLPGKAEL